MDFRFIEVEIKISSANLLLMMPPESSRMKSRTKETLINCLCGRIAKLSCRAVRYCQQVQIVPVGSIYRNLNIFLYMPRFLRSVRLALHPAQTINQGFPNGPLAKSNAACVWDGGL